MSEPKILKVVTGLKTNGTTINSKGADYAVIGKWADGNTSNQDRKGLFVKLDNLTDGMTMSIAGPDDNVRGIITSTPAFCENAQASYFNEDGSLKTGYDYVGILGVVSVKDSGTLSANDYCMPDSTGKAVKVSGEYGYQVVDRVDSTHVRVIVEPGADSSYRIAQNSGDLSVEVGAEGGSATGINATSLAGISGDKFVQYEASSPASVVGTINADSLGGLPASSYAKQADMTQVSATVSTMSTNVATLMNTKSVICVLYAANWAGSAAPYTQTISVAGMSASWVPVSLAWSGGVDELSTKKEALKQTGYVNEIISAEGAITFICYENKPSWDLWFRVAGTPIQSGPY